MRQWSMDLTGDSPGRQLAEPPLRSRRNINCPDDATSMRIKGGGSSSTIYTRPARSSTTTAEAYGSTQPHNNYSNNNNNNFSNTRTMMMMAEDDELPRPVRLSRHIPQREGPADMDLSAYNLLVGSGGSGLVPSCTPTTTTTTTTSAGANLSSVHGGFLRHTATPPPSLSASVSESMVSDDSAYMSSLYNDLLAEQLINRGADLSATRDGGVGVAVVGGGGAGGRPASPTATEMSAGRRLGGDVLRFGSPSHGGAAPTSGVGASLNIEASGILPASPSLGHLHTPQSPVLGSPFFLTSRTRRGGGGGGGVSGSGASGTSGAGVGLMSGGGGGGGTSSRLWMSANPERVLDAPNFPRRARQLLHWGSNNQIVIGLRNTLYTWSATTAQSGKLLELQDDASNNNNNNSSGGGGGTIRCLSWLHRCSCVAMGIDGSTVGIFDCRAESFLRTLRLPQDEEAVGLATNGPILAVATTTTNNNSNNTYSGVGVARIFDLRQKNAHVALFSGFHDGQISSLHYSSAEPYYLATGGDDGGIGVWDLRQHHCPRYAMPNIHRGPVPALHWSNARRSRIYSGGADGVVCVLDTHAHPFPANTADADDAEDDDDVLLYDDERHGGVRGGGGGSGASAAARAAHAAGFVVRAVNSHLPISGIVCQASNNVGVRGGGGGGDANLEHIVTAHRQQGQLQLRHGTSLVLHGISRATACDADLSCITAAPDGEQVCAAQDDETLKFWRMFPPSQDAQMGSGRSKYGRCLGSYASNNNNNNNSGGGGTSSSSSRHPHRDPFFKLEEQLR